MSDAAMPTWSPRGPLAEVGGYIWLPRLLDKARQLAAEPNVGYVSLDASFMDTQFMRALRLSSAQLDGWIKEGLSDEAIAARIAQHAGHDEAAAAAWSARFSGKFGLAFLAMDADEGRMAPGPLQQVLKGLVNLGFAIATAGKR
jgi:hypothetical protein